MADRESVVFVTEPLLTTEFVQFRTQAPLLQRLAATFDVTVAAPVMSPDVRRAFEDMGVRALSANGLFPPARHSHDEVPSFIASWGRDAVLGLNRRALTPLVQGLPGLHVNMSMTTAIEADLWYIQGRPLDTSMAAMGPSLSPPLRMVAKLTGPAVGLVDRPHFRLCSQLSKGIYTNSRFNALWFREQGIDVRGVVSQFFSSRGFAPSSTHPARDYILAYLGKETDTAAIKLLMELDFPIKMFGAKSSGWVEGALKGSPTGQVEFLGRVSEEELASLYSNALFTAFPFTEEPFGLVPVESMACGTPVLTYRWQGPGETVLDKRTGWLTGSPSRFIVKAHEICEKGYPASMAEACRQRAEKYFVDHVAAVWKDLLNARLHGAEEPEEVRQPMEGLPLAEGASISKRRVLRQPSESD